MTHPSAPMLQAEYYSHNEQAAFNDYYGGYEPRTHDTTGPRRLDATAEKNASRCRDSSTMTIHCLNATIVFRSVVHLAICFLLFQAGYRQEFIYYLAAFESLSLMASILMCCGVEHRQPFFCILFTVFRTMEAFLALLLTMAFGYAVYDKRSDAAKFIRSVTREYGTNMAPKSNIGWDDLAFQLSVALFVLSLLALAFCLFACRVAWTSTMQATDDRRRLRAMRNHEVSRVMVASDELYTNY